MSLLRLSTHRNTALFPCSDFEPQRDIPPGWQAAVMDSSRWACEQAGLREFREHVGGHRPRRSLLCYTAVYRLPHRAELRFPERQELHRRRLRADQPARPVLRADDSRPADIQHRDNADSVDVRRCDHRVWVVRIVELRRCGRFAPPSALTPGQPFCRLPRSPFPKPIRLAKTREAAVLPAASAGASACSGSPCSAGSYGAAGTPAAVVAHAPWHACFMS